MPASVQDSADTGMDFALCLAQAEGKSHLVTLLSTEYVYKNGEEGRQELLLPEWGGQRPSR
jgi:hypothetical protein